jgi:putative hydrolase of HD superfamily
VQALKQLPRSGWLLGGVTSPESVADHTLGTALLAHTLAHVVNIDYHTQGLCGPLDVGRVTLIALVHDLAESVMTDLPKRTSDMLGAEVKHRAEERVLVEISSQLACGDEVLTLWREYDGSLTPEARLVRDADKLEMVYQALAYERSGNRNLDDFWRGHRWHYPATEALFARLTAARGTIRAQ